MSALQIAENPGFVSGHRFSDAVSSLNSVAPSGAGPGERSFSANCLAAEVERRCGKYFFRSLLGPGRVVVSRKQSPTAAPPPPLTPPPARATLVSNGW